VAYRSILGNECLDRYDKTALSRAKTGVPKLGRDLAKAAEAKGLLYSADPVRSDGQTSAFRYFETIGDYADANRVMLRAVQAKPDDLALFTTAWGVDEGRSGGAGSENGSASALCLAAGLSSGLAEDGVRDGRSADESGRAGCEGALGQRDRSGRGHHDVS
jgi:hypothetical protein